MDIGENQTVAPAELKQIRALSDFNLVMLISEVHDHGWPLARTTLAMMPGGPDASRPTGRG